VKKLSRRRATRRVVDDAEAASHERGVGPACLAGLPNARRLREALTDFGFGDVAPAVPELARADKVFMLGRKPWRIDVLTGIDGVSLKRAS